MFALLALFVAGAAAAPQVPVYQYLYPQYQQYYNYPQVYYPQVQQLQFPQQQFRYLPQSYFPGSVSPLKAQTRVNQFGFDFAGFESRNADFETSGTTQVMAGNAEFRQNIFTGDNMDYTIFMDNDVGNTLSLANKMFGLWISTDCTTANGAKMTDITAPFILINGFYAKGTTTGWNKDGSAGKTTLVGKRVVVTDAAAANAVVGCTAVLV